MYLYIDAAMSGVGGAVLQFGDGGRPRPPRRSCPSEAP